MSLAELRPHLHSLPDHPDWIPYRTSYYREAWGFCLRHRDVRALSRGRVRGLHRRTLAPGHPDLCRMPAARRAAEEFLLYTHVCHPSLVQRQPDRHRGARDSLGRALREGAAPLHVSPRIRAGNHRFDHLAGAQRGGSPERIASRTGARLAGRSRSADLQAQPRGTFDIDRIAQTHVLREAGARRGSARFLIRTAMMSASSVRRGSTCRSAD